MNLKDHFSQDVADDIESVFLISKSNCAFINYRTEAVCSAAQTKFHDSRFQGVRLVCRLRRGPISAGSNGKSGDRPAVKSECEKIPESESAGNKPLSSARLPNRYFVVKSLTMEDLESSRQSGIWATQTHNETNLNRAYDVSFPLSFSFWLKITWWFARFVFFDVLANGRFADFDFLRPQTMFISSSRQTSPASIMDMHEWCRPFKRTKN